jgi:hypothetical protein
MRGAKLQKLRLRGALRNVIVPFLAVASSWDSGLLNMAPRVQLYEIYDKPW